MEKELRPREDRGTGVMSAKWHFPLEKIPIGQLSMDQTTQGEFWSPLRKLQHTVEPKSIKRE